METQALTVASRSTWKHRACHIWPP